MIKDLLDIAKRLFVLARREHLEVQGDTWFSCPLSIDGCANEKETGCNCGAEAHNAKVDRLLEEFGQLG